ncbi:hypothetical protein KP509_06G070200 [Ceratopteris richardii]|uniref:Uncharacterized protein n=1 Tax=Ceratopteris richardii TaxID=49495 RepID=A0A8T2UNW6_CERRI|nr:hypothetical protein KP509_06G070200 [Ceratopteris richardii]
MARISFSSKICMLLVTLMAVASALPRLGVVLPASAHETGDAHTHDAPAPSPEGHPHSAAASLPLLHWTMVALPMLVLSTVFSVRR